MAHRRHPCIPTRETPLKKADIVLVDDTPEVAELLTFALTDHGFAVMTTGFDTQIDEQLLREAPEAVVLDCSVYAMSETLFDSIRRHDQLAELPIVIITDTPELAMPSLQARGATHVLLIPKPFSGSQVARALDQLLQPGDHPTDDQ